MLRLGDYADGNWWFLCACAACGRTSRLEPADVLAHGPPLYRDMRLGEIERRLRCRHCRRRRGHLEPVPRLPKHAFVGGLI